MKLPTIIGITSTVSIAVGAATSYFITKSYLDKKHERILAFEIQSAKEFYSVLHKRGAFETVDSAIKELHGNTSVDDVLPETLQRVVKNNLVEAAKALQTYSGRAQDGAEAVNVFDNTSDNDDEDLIPEEELRNRTEEAPYVITSTEFMSNESGFTQVTLTYFAGDGVLVDSKERTVDDIDDAVGENNLKKFGYKSKDPRVVYVRNDSLDLEFEILKSDGHYSKEVLGL